MDNSRQILRGYFMAILPFCDREKVLSLFADCGYQDLQSVTAADCMTAYDECGQMFSIPFGKIAAQALESSQMEAYKRANGIDDEALNKATDGEDATKSDNQTKAETGLKYLGAITDILKTGSDYYKTYKNGGVTDAVESGSAASSSSSNNNNSGSSDASQTANNAWVKYAIIGGVALVVVVLVVVLVRKK
jgi:cobalamin biosynthesis Mg chelatase CobN